MRGKPRRIWSTADIARLTKGATKGAGREVVQVWEEPDGKLVVNFTPALEQEAEGNDFDRLLAAKRKRPSP